MDSRDLLGFVDIILLFMLMIVEYFSMIFQNYVKVILGLSEISVWFYIYFLLTFVCSWLLMTPRIYIIWVIFLTLNIVILLKELLYNLFVEKSEYYKGYIQCYYLSDLHFDQSFMIYIIRFIWCFIDKKRIRYLNNSLIRGFCDVEFSMKDWKLIYNEGLVKDYILYSSVFLWSRNSESLRYIKDIFYVFEYSLERYKNIINRIVCSSLGVARGLSSSLSNVKEDGSVDICVMEAIKEDCLKGCEYSVEELIENLPPLELWWLIHTNYIEDTEKWDGGFFEIFKKEHKI